MGICILSLQLFFANKIYSMAEDAYPLQTGNDIKMVMNKYKKTIIVRIGKWLRQYPSKHEA